ncbi:MAG: tryptophan transporter [Clostridiales bacterium]|nr:tryptophan transporter [Clostridiales bacterium]
MNTKKMIIDAILIAIGVVLHVLAPSIGLPMQPDFALAMLFIIMLLNKDYKTTLFTGIILGIFTALTTKSPGGQLPNIIDKLVTCNLMYLLILPLRDRINKNLLAGGMLFVGTLISGTAFLVSYALIGIELPANLIFPTIVSVVIPTAIINLIIGLIIYKIVEQTIKRTGFKM